MPTNRILPYAYCWQSQRFKPTDPNETARQDAFADMADEDYDEEHDEEYDGEAFPPATYEEMRASVCSAVERVGRNRVFTVIEEITGVGDLSIIPPEQYGEVVDAMTFLQPNP